MQSFVFFDHLLLEFVFLIFLLKLELISMIYLQRSSAVPFSDTFLGPGPSLITYLQVFVYIEYD